MQFHVIFPAVIAAVAMIMDLKTAKVDNGWILFCLGIGLLMRLAENRPGGLTEYAGGAIMPLLLLGWLFLFRMLGAGDIKLFCALGGFLGVEKILLCIIFSMLIGAGISIAILVTSDGIYERFLYFFHYMNEIFCARELKPYRSSGITSLENFHFTVPVFLSVLLYVGGVY